MILVRTIYFHDYENVYETESKYVLLKRHTFIEFLHRKGNEELLEAIKENVVFTSDAWLNQELPEDEIGWGLTIADLEEELKKGVESFIHFLGDKDYGIVEHPYNWSSIGPDYGFILESAILTETESFMATNIINQYEKALKNYNELHRLTNTFI